MTILENQDKLDKGLYDELKYSFISDCYDMRWERINERYVFKSDFLEKYFASGLFNKIYESEQLPGNIDSFNSAFNNILILFSKQHKISEDMLINCINKIFETSLSGIASTLTEIDSSFLLNVQILKALFRKNPDIFNWLTLNVNKSDFIKLSKEHKELIIKFSINKFDIDKEEISNNYKYITINIADDIDNQKLFPEYTPDELIKFFDENNNKGSKVHFNIGKEMSDLSIEDYFKFIDKFSNYDDSGIMDYFKINDIDFNKIDKSLFHHIDLKNNFKIRRLFVDYINKENIIYFVKHFALSLDLAINTNEKLSFDDIIEITTTFNKTEHFLKRININVMKKFITEEDLIKYPWIISPDILKEHDYIYHSKSTMQILNKYWKKRQRYEYRPIDVCLGYLSWQLSDEIKIKYLNYYMNHADFESIDEKRKNKAIKLFLDDFNSKKSDIRFKTLRSFLYKYE